MTIFFLHKNFCLKRFHYRQTNEILKGFNIFYFILFDVVYWETSIFTRKKDVNERETKFLFPNRTSLSVIRSFGRLYQIETKFIYF